MAHHQRITSCTAHAQTINYQTPLLRNQTMQYGTASVFLRSVSPAPLLQAEERRAAEEVESVLSMLESSSSGRISRSKVVNIERIQHARLWKRYCLKRQEIIESRGDAGMQTLGITETTQTTVLVCLARHATLRGTSCCC